MHEVVLKNALIYGLKTDSKNNLIKIKYVEKIDMRRCPNCNAITPNTHFCKHCGAKLDSYENNEDDELIEEFLIIELTEEEDEES